MKKKFRIITYEQLDHIAMEFLTKQKIKFLYVCGGEKEKIFVTKMVDRFVVNRTFSDKELKLITKTFEDFNADRKKENSHSI